MQRPANPEYPFDSAQKVRNVIKNMNKAVNENGRLVKSGLSEAFNTKEQPITGQFLIPPDSLTLLIENLKGDIDPEILSREQQEYDELLAVVKRVTTEEFQRDPAGRKAVVLHPGCMTYQHYFIRDRHLFASIHMRGMDIRKAAADYHFMLRAIQTVVNYSWPFDRKETPVVAIHLRLMVDCFHAYITPAAVAV